MQFGKEQMKIETNAGISLMYEIDRILKNPMSIDDIIYDLNNIGKKINNDNNQIQAVEREKINNRIIKFIEDEIYSALDNDFISSDENNIAYYDILELKNVFDIDSNKIINLVTESILLYIKKIIVMIVLLVLL